MAMTAAGVLLNGDRDWWMDSMVRTMVRGE